MHTLVRLSAGAARRAASPALALSLALVAGLGAGLAQPAPEIEACLERLVPRTEWMADPDSTWSIALAAPSGGALRFVGAKHVTDPSDPQFAAIGAAWDSLRPERAFFEGPDRGFAETAGATIEAYGESGYVRFLADRDGVPVSTLEPSPMDEAAWLYERFPEDQVVLFYLLREAARLRERRGMEGPGIEAAIADLIARAEEMGLIRGEIRSVDALARAYRTHWDDPGEWWRAPTDWFDPMRPSSETGGIFTNEVNAASSAYRDRHMAALLARHARSGERVFAVVGRNHVPLQAPALACAIEGEEAR